MPENSRRRGRDTNRPASSSARPDNAAAETCLGQYGPFLVPVRLIPAPFPGHHGRLGQLIQGGGFASAADARYTAIPCVRSAARCT